VSAPEEALARAELTAKIAEIIFSRKLTQAAAAEILGLDRPKVSALLRGRLAGFSTDRLLRFLTALGQDVDRDPAGARAWAPARRICVEGALGPR
jgi:predicted XRE-type DNA-binding protein